MWIGSQTQSNSEGSPLSRAGNKSPVFHRQVSRADCLWSQTIKQWHFWARYNTHCKTNTQMKTEAEFLLQSVSTEVLYVYFTYFK